MAREGTRSSTGNSKPRVFPAVDTTPTVKRPRKSKTAGLLGGKVDKTATTPTAAPVAVGNDNTTPSVSKKSAPPKKAGGLVTKVSCFTMTFTFALPSLSPSQLNGATSRAHTCSGGGV